MMHPLESATQAAVKEHEKLRTQINTLTQQIRDLEQYCQQKDGELAAITRELVASQTKADHYLRWNVEITRQLHNINMFVQEALKTARVEVEKKKIPPEMLETVKELEKGLEAQVIQSSGGNKNIDNRERVL